MQPPPLPRQWPKGLVDLHMVALLRLQLLDEVGPLHTVLSSTLLEALLEAALHALQTAHVHVRLGALEALPELLGIVHGPVLHPHLAVDLVLLALLLRGDGVVVAELVGVRGLHGLPLAVIEQGVGEGHTQEEPRHALELALGALVMEEAPEEGAEGRHARARGKHDDVRIVLLREQHLGTHGPGDEHVLPRFQVTDVAGADTAVHQFRIWELRVGSWLHVGVLAPAHAVNLQDALHAQGHGVGGLVVARRGGGDGVEPNLRRLLTLLVRPRGNDADGLALDVGHLLVVAHDDVASLPVGKACPCGDGVVRDAGTLVRGLRAENVPGYLLALDDAHALLLHRRSTACHGPCCCNASCCEGRDPDRGRCRP
mmetsp:Transcript_99021/g.319296  ORF Transcript_99021/g.319296 Transcript_99021/m.319296 type:complete len:370 (-) Transcript_99021:227-1336(-)